MADNPTDSNVSQQPSEAQPGETTTSEAPPDGGSPETQAPESKQRSTLRGAGLKYGENDDVPKWARGKTADEIVEITEQLRRNVISGGVPSTNAAPTPTSTTSETTPTVNGTPGGDGASLPQLSADDMYSNPEKFTRDLQQYVTAATQSHIAQASQGLTTPLVGMARDRSMKGEYSEVWDRFGPEIDALMQNVPMQSRANPEMWDQAAEMVAGRHWRELAISEAEKAAARNTSGMVPSDGRTAAPSVQGEVTPIRRLFLDDDPSIQGYRREGLSAEDVINHARRMGHSEEAYAEMIKNKRNIRRYQKDGGRTTTEPAHV